jgi:hypothetical protein
VFSWIAIPDAIKINGRLISLVTEMANVLFAISNASLLDQSFRQNRGAAPFAVQKLNIAN